MNDLERTVNLEDLVIENDYTAEWIVCQIAKKRNDANIKINNLRKTIAEYEEKIKDIEEMLEEEVAPLEKMLEDWFEKCDVIKAKTQETYKLPSGTLKRKYQQPLFKKNEKQLIGWLKWKNLKEYIKTSESTDWAKLKKQIQIEGNKAFFNGDIVDGLEVEERPPKFEVET
jgi:hypothetical protein